MASARHHAVVAEEREIISNPSDHRNFTKISGAAAASGNKTATFEDQSGNQWIGKKTTGLAGAVSEVVAQRLATAVLGANRAPITLLANDGTVFSQKPLGPSANLEEFFSDTENLHDLTDEAKKSIQNSFLDAVVFKAITGDCDIKPDNFVIDINSKVVIPIDGESAFPGTSAGTDSYGTWSKAEFHRFINDPAGYVNDMFNAEAGCEAGFLSQDIDPDALLMKFYQQTEDIFKNDYALVSAVIQDTTLDLVGFDAEEGTLSNDHELAVELDSKISKIKPMIEAHVNEIYGYILEMANG